MGSSFFLFDRDFHVIVQSGGSMKQELELLAPAGTLQTLKAVISAGADAVYFGGSRFGARAYAGNFNKEEVLEAIDFSHIHGKKVFMALNTLLKEKELEEELYEYLLPYYEHGLDAVIVQDFGVMQFVRRNFKELPIHTSTQMTVTNVEGARLLKEAGASRIVMARELSLEEIHRIKKEVSVELESFVHGALCYCYSGQCLFSSMLGGRSGNRGRCAQPCRLPYEAFTTKAGYPLSPKDLCTIDMIPQLAENGVYSFKIEGRMKRAEYAAGVVSVYRKYMDYYRMQGKEGYHVSKKDHQKLFDFGNRSGFTEGYYKQWNGADMITFTKPGHEKNNEALWKQVAEDYIQTECKEKITGHMKVFKDLPIELKVAIADTEVTVTGAVAGEAKNQPLTEETLQAKITKTGNTPFVFENLTIDLEDGLFLSMGAVNELKRQALDALEAECLQKYRRIQQEDCIHLPLGEENNQILDSKICMTASVEREEQIQPLLKDERISVIYVDSSVFKREDILPKMQKLFDKTKDVGKELYYILPAVFRHKTSAFYETILSQIKADGFLVKNYDALGFLLSHHISPKRIRIDHNLYTFSRESRQAFGKLKIAGDTIPLELNRKEIRQRENQNSEILIYGYLPLMTSVQCLNKNINGCDKIPKISYLKDRYGISFPVKNHCQECYNVIYNSKPLQLFSVVDELISFGVYRFRLSFTNESKEQVEKVLCISKDSPLENRNDYTYGHYKRGVE